MSTSPPPDESGFLGRWSRRKRAAAAGIGEPAAPEPDAPSRAQPDAMPDPEQAALPEAGPQEEPFVEPPALDTIGEDFDLSYWLRQKVPDVWKRQALRHAWSADPAIRDFKGLADYDLDYNTPGMAPGYGPLNESDDVAAMARKIFGEPEPEAVARDSQPQDHPAQTSSEASDHALAASRQAEAAGDLGTPTARQDAPDPATKGDEFAQDQAESDAASQQTVPDQRENPQMIVRIRRRGGGAMPT